MPQSTKILLFPTVRSQHRVVGDAFAGYPRFAKVFYREALPLIVAGKAVPIVTKADRADPKL